MAADFVTNLIEGKIDEAKGEVWEHDELFFFVDWREEEEQIAGYCDKLIGPGAVEALWREQDLVYQRGERAVTLPLTHTPADRHIALLSLNELLAPEYECRYVWASNGADTAAMLPLRASEWEALERKHGAAAVDRAFMQCAPRPTSSPTRSSAPRPSRVGAYGEGGPRFGSPP